jgi:hypothetical protein
LLSGVRLDALPSPATKHLDVEHLGTIVSTLGDPAALSAARPSRSYLYFWRFS